MTQNFDRNEAQKFSNSIEIISKKVESGQSLTTQDRQQLTDYYTYLFSKKGLGIRNGSMLAINNKRFVNL